MASGTGPADEHDLVVIKTDLGPGGLPVDADNKVLEDGAGIEFIGEIEGIAVGGTDQADFVLEPGTYVLICTSCRRNRMARSNLTTWSACAPRSR